MALNRTHNQCGLSELDYYNTGKIFQKDIHYDFFSVLTPKNSLVTASPILFQIDACSDFVDLGATELITTFSMLNNDGGRPVASDQVSVINNILHSFFSQVEVSLNGKGISHNSPNYHFRCYLENLLNYSQQAKDTWLKSEGWYSDTKDRLDLVTNAALGHRKELFKGDDKSATFVSRLHTDINLQKHLIPSNVDIAYTLIPARKEFVMQNYTDPHKEFSLVLEDIKMKVRKVKLTPEMTHNFERNILKQAIRIPITYVKMTTVTLSSGITSFEKNALFSGALPEKVIFGLVENESYTGSLTTSPYNFQTFNLSSAQFHLNGRQIPTQAIQPNYATGEIYDAYNSLNETLGVKYADWSNGITLDMYTKGFCLYGCDFSSGTACLNDTSSIGALDISLKFSSPLASTTTLILYSSMDSAVIIDRYRNVICEH